MPNATYIDSFSVPRAKADASIVEIYAAVLGALPPWFKALMMVRTALVAPLGIAGPGWAELNRRIDTTRAYAVGDTIGRWRIDHIDADEIIAGYDDRHLDFRVSVRRGADIVLTTAVKTHNAFGRLYLATIKPFHRFGVRRLLTNASKAARV